MIILGIILLILALVVPVPPVVLYLGVILIIVGAVLYLAPNLTGGRRWY